MNRQESSKGFVILAVNHPSYALWAFNQAVSVRKFNTLPICLLYDQKAISALDDWQLEVFDQRIEIPTEAFHRNGTFEGGLLKLSMHQYFPFDETIYLDADGLQVASLDWVWEYATKHDSTFLTDWSTRQDWILWEDYQKYGIKELPGIQSSFQYYRKEAQPIFEKARELFHMEPADPMYPKQSMQWGYSKAKPDELYLVLAASILKWDMFVKEGNEYRVAIYFRMKGDKKLSGNLQDDSLQEVMEKYSAIGLFGNHTTSHPSLVRWYDILSKQYNSERFNSHAPFYKAETLLKHKLMNVR
jgi:hypothetical protein